MAPPKAKPKPKPTPKAKQPEPRPAAEPPPAAALDWVLNGAVWEADSARAPGRKYVCRHTAERGWSAGYAGQKQSCPAAGVFFHLAADARAKCRELEDSIQ